MITVVRLLTRHDPFYRVVLRLERHMPLLEPPKCFARNTSAHHVRASKTTDVQSRSKRVVSRERTFSTNNPEKPYRVSIII